MAITLTTFVPGTKAKADEVNANFSTLKDAIEEKAAIDGDSSQTFAVANSTADSHAVNKSQLDYLSQNLTLEIKKAGTKFCVKSGYTTDGKGDLFSYSVLSVTPKIGGTYGSLVISDYEGTQTIITSTSSFSMSGKPNGTYNIFIKPDGTIYTLSNKIYVQQARPSMSDGDVWLDTSVEPLNCVKYDGTNDNEFLDVPLGYVVISNSAITTLETFPFNQNGYDINSNTLKTFKYDYANPVTKSTGVTYTAETDGLIFARHANINDTITVTIDGFSITLGWSSSQGSGSSGLLPIAKGQTYLFSGGDVHYFIPYVEV